MAIMNFLRKVLKKRGLKPTLAYVEDQPTENETVMLKPQHSTEKNIDGLNGEIDLTRQGDLEGYARDINVSKESIERWICSGLLMPEELKVAEKLVQILRKH
jgi:hypothetical protein